MIVAILAIFAAVVIITTTTIFVAKLYKAFTRARLSALSIAAQTDSVGSVGISILCPAPTNIKTVINLLDSNYPNTEIVIALNKLSHRNLLSQLAIRYSLRPAYISDQCVYRSSRAAFRRLVVVASEYTLSKEQLADIAATHALYHHLLIIHSEYRLLPYAIGIIADAISSDRGEVAIMDSDITLITRHQWRKQDNLCNSKHQKRVKTANIISEPLLFDNNTIIHKAVAIERSRYNFWDFLSLNIMKYRNKLLSLKKP